MLCEIDFRSAIHLVGFGHLFQGFYRYVIYFLSERPMYKWKKKSREIVRWECKEDRRIWYMYKCHLTGLKPILFLMKMLKKTHVVLIPKCIFSKRKMKYSFNNLFMFWKIPTIECYNSLWLINKWIYDLYYNYVLIAQSKEMLRRVKKYKNWNISRLVRTYYITPDADP